MHKFLLVVCFFGLVALLFLYGRQKPYNVVTPVTRYTITPKPSVVTEIPNLSIELIFDQDITSLFPQDDLIKIVATGDYILGRSVNYKTIQYANYAWSVEEFKDVLYNSDFTLINLESPLLKDCPLANEGFVFCGTNKHLEGLKFAGIDVVNIANNHFGDYGNSGVTETVELLTNNNISVSGEYNNNLAIKEVKNTKIGFLGYNDIGSEPGVAFADTEIMYTEIQAARKKVDILIVSIHAGIEYTTVISDRQKELSRLAIDAGADLVVGNHAHWIQPLEIYKNKLITYAHGNFIFDQMWSEQTKYGVVGEYYFYKNKLVDVNYIPNYIEDYGKATQPSKDLSVKILKDFYAVSLEYSKLPEN